MSVASESRGTGRSGMLTLALLGLALGCAASPPAAEEDPVERGRALFDSLALSPSGLNLFSCSTCHDVVAGESAERKAGAPLGGVTLRASYWGGEEVDLLRAINACRRYFMYASTPLSPGEPDADALYHYLDSLEPQRLDPVPFTVVRSIAPLPRGDATRGQGVFTSACAPCHGSLDTGAGKLRDGVPVLPGDTLLEHPAPTYTPHVVRLVFIEKTRHGGFLNYGGVMPPFSLEALPDADLSDVLEALRVLGQ